MLYRNCNTSQYSYSSILVIQIGEFLHWILSLFKFMKPRFPWIDCIGLVIAQKSLGRNLSSADLKQVLGTQSTENYFSMINECYQVWTALNSDFSKHKESVYVCVHTPVHTRAHGLESHRDSHLTTCHFHPHPLSSLSKES